MRAVLLAGAIAAAAPAAMADGYIMGAGRWTCAEVAKTAQEGKPIEVGQLAGWILGFWSRSTQARETAFIDTVEKVGGKRIYELTIEQCRKAGPDVLLHRVAESMIKNTK